MDFSDLAGLTLSPEEVAAKAQLISQVTVLQLKLRDTLMQLETSRAEQTSLAAENEVLQKYIDNLMSSSVGPKEGTT